MVSSLRIFPSSTMPSWPMEEYGSSAMSVKTIDSGSASLIIRTARGTIPSGLYDSSPRFDLSSSSTFGKRMKERTPYCHASCASASIDGSECRSQPGIDAISAFSATSWMKSGYTKLAGVSDVSRTIRRTAALLRLRRGRGR